MFIVRKPSNVINSAKKQLLQDKIRHHYAKRSKLGIKLYTLHLKITRSFDEKNSFKKWCDFQRQTIDRIKRKFQLKMIR